MTRPIVSYQGEPGSNSDEMCKSQFPDHETLPCDTFEEAFEAARDGRALLAMIPVENSQAGRVADVHHLLPNSGLKIIAERFKRIRFDLMANPGTRLSDIGTVMSHVMALAQCRGLIREHGFRVETVGDTAGAARILSQQPDASKGALAPPSAAEIYGLVPLIRDVEDTQDNTTRFVVLTADPSPPRPPEGIPCVTSFVFRVRNVPAALYKAMGGFATNGVNMTKLESYSEAGGFYATMFYAEVDGRPEDPNLRLAIEELGFFSERFEVLGVYPADPFRKTA